MKNLKVVSMKKILHLYFGLVMGLGVLEYGMYKNACNDFEKYSPKSRIERANNFIKSWNESTLESKIAMIGPYISAKKYSL